MDLFLDLDYSLLQSVVTFRPNETSINVTIVANDDDIVEKTESFSLRILISDTLKNSGILNSVKKGKDNDRPLFTIIGFGEIDLTPPVFSSVSISIYDNDSKKLTS